MPTIYMILPSGNFHWLYVIQRLESALGVVSVTLVAFPFAFPLLGAPTAESCSRLDFSLGNENP